METLFLDMDGVLVDFDSGIARLDADLRDRYAGRLDDVPGIFALMDPMPGALDAFGQLSGVYDTYLLSTAPWDNPTAWSDKLAWVKRHLGDPAHKRLTLTHHKNLARGHILVDDRDRHGAADFDGDWIRFGTAPWHDWATVLPHLLDRAARRSTTP